MTSHDGEVFTRQHQSVVDAARRSLLWLADSWVLWLITLLTLFGGSMALAPLYDWLSPSDLLTIAFYLRLAESLVAAMVFVSLALSCFQTNLQDD